MNFKRLAFQLVSALFFTMVLIPVSHAVRIEQGGLKVTQYQLSNGLTVILNEDHAQPQVFGVVAVKAGGKNDPSDATGLAHYMEHMLFKGTQQLGTTDWEKEKVHIDKIFELYEKLGKTASPDERKAIQMEISDESYLASEFAIPNELSNLINSMGGTSLNAGTGPDYTVYYNKFPASQIYKWLDLYAHRFMHPVFRGFQAELEVVYEEQNMYSDMFQSRLIEDFQKHFFKNHPYGQQPLIGTIEHLKNPSLNRMLEFYETYYVANNMVLVLSGDFDTEEITPIIEEKFGLWPTGVVPEPTVYPEEGFKGRELVEVRISPIKIGILGYRTVTEGHPDYIPLEVAMSLLNNNNETGLLDKLMLDGDVMAAQTMGMPYNDHGACIVLFVPKLVGQKLQSAENLIISQISRLGKGDFDEKMLEAVKLRLYIDFQKSLESLENRAVMLATAFTSGLDIQEVLSYPEKVMAVTTEDVKRVASTYFGDNFLSFHSKMGFPKKEKIEKPGFKALQANTNAKSEYTIHYESIPSRPVHISPVDFEKDVITKQIKDGVTLLHVNNPIHDIFSLQIQYQVGNYHLDLLEEAAELMALAGTENRSMDELKREFANIGCTYSVWSNDSYTYVSLEGIEDNLHQALPLLNELLTAPVIEQKRVKVAYNAEKTNRKMEQTEPRGVAGALQGFMLYGNKSETLDRITLKELKKVESTELTKVFKEAIGYGAKIHYVGKQTPEVIQALIRKELSFTDQPKVAETPVVKPIRKIEANTVYFVDMKKARQSQIYLFANGDVFDKSLEPTMDAFNEYFGGGFSGLVLQEIREYRSLAYGAAGNFSFPPIKGKPFNFRGFLSTQSDKTLTAIETFDSLVRTMPEKPERLDMIKDYLMLSSETKRPGFRQLSQTVERWKLMGYTQDPFITLQPAYEALTWEGLMSFYREHLSQKPMGIAIVGDKRNIELKELEKYGKITKMKEKQLFSK